MSTVALLDKIGREIVFFLVDSYTLIGVALVVILVVFAYWRKFRYGEWPTVTDCLIVVFSILTMLTGTTVAVVFLMTRPPAVDLLPKSTLLIIGLANLVVGVAYAFPKLWSAFNPPAPDE